MKPQIKKFLFALCLLASKTVVSQNIYLGTNFGAGRWNYTDGDFLLDSGYINQIWFNRLSSNYYIGLNGAIQLDSSICRLEFNLNHKSRENRHFSYTYLDYTVGGHLILGKKITLSLGCGPY